MKLLFIVLSLVIAQASFAKCPEMAKKSLSKDKASVKIKGEVYRDFYAPLKHYRAELQAKDAYIDSVKINAKGDKIIGYEVFITDGGDESMTRYVLNAKKQLVVMYWYNQSPMTYWFCGKTNTTEIDYTDDGSEIN